MEKRISVNEFRSAVRVAQACNPLHIQREKIKQKIAKLAEEYKSYDNQISALEAGIVSLIGLRVEDIVKKVIESGIDVHGNPKKTTKYVGTSLVSYDPVKKQYVITIPDQETQEQPQTTEQEEQEEQVEDNTPEDEEIF